MNYLEAIDMAMNGAIVAREDLPSEIYFKSQDGELVLYDQNDGQYYEVKITQEDADADWIVYVQDDELTPLQFFMMMFEQPECPDGCECDCTECCGGEGVGLEQCPAECTGCPGNAGKYPECEGCDGCEGACSSPEEDITIDVLTVLSEIKEKMAAIEKENSTLREVVDKLQAEKKEKEAFDFNKFFEKQCPSATWKFPSTGDKFPIDPGIIYCNVTA